MKVNIRKEELKAILSAYFRMDVEDFTVSPAEPSSLGKLIRKAIHRPLDKEIKIGNIKTLRAVAVDIGKPMTLMEGKWAIENWVTFIGFVDEYNRLPLGGYGCGAPNAGKLE